MIELYYETEWYEAPPELRPSLKNQAQRYPGARRQRPPAGPLQLLAVDVAGDREFFEKYLGFRTTEQHRARQRHRGRRVADLHE